MASGYLIRSDAQAIGHDPAHELGREEPVPVHSTNRVGTGGHPSSGHGA